MGYFYCSWDMGLWLLIWAMVMVMVIDMGYGYGYGYGGVVVGSWIW